MNFGQFRLGLLSSNLTNTLSYDVDNASKLLPTVPSFTLTNSDSTSLGKILANPTIVAMDGTQSNINITDEVATILQTTTTSIPPVISTEIKKEQAGVTMEITPTVFNDGTVQLNLKPTVKQPIRELRVGGSSTFLLSERSVEIAGVRVKDGQTLVIGGSAARNGQRRLNQSPGFRRFTHFGRHVSQRQHLTKNADRAGA
jgi:type II secretory pathway component HofQ